MPDQDYEQLLASLPAAVRAAIEAVDLDAFQCAMDELPAEQAELITQQLESAGIIGRGPASEIEYQAMLKEFDLLIQAVIRGADGNQVEQEQVLMVLPRIESAGYHLSEVIPRIWAGERSASQLTADLDPNSARLVKHILTRLRANAADGIIEITDLDQVAIAESIPPAVLIAIETQDELAFEQAMQSLPLAERQYVASQLARLQAQADADAEAWLASLPANVRGAVLDQDPLRLQSALEALPPSEAQEILDQLEASGILQDIDDSRSQQILLEFEPLILAVVEIARGNLAARQQVEALLIDLNKQGWPLLEPIQHIWAGERSLPILSAEIEQQEETGISWIQPFAHQIIQRILEELSPPD